MIKVGIIGLGLIGSSILRGLCGKYEIYCYSKSSYQKAKAYCALASDDIEIVKQCSIIFVCCEISKTLETLNKLNTFLDKDTVVLDCASCKKELLNKEFNFNFILSHPMAGTEKSGFEAGCCDLFKGAKWLIEKKHPQVEKIILELGAYPLVVDMNFHDYMCAQISHLPVVLSFLIFDCAQDSSKQIASSGFRDMTRLAMTDKKLIYDMLFYNEENILKAFDEITDRLNYLKKLSKDEKIKLFDAISNKRKKMYDENGKNIFKI